MATVCVLGVAAIGLRTVGLESSLWVDETYTALVYVRGGPSEILGGEFTINNHILFSLVGWALTSIGGEHEWLLRSAAVVPALGAVAIVSRWLQRRFGTVSAIAAGALIVSSREHLILSRQARGYGLVYLAAALALVAADALLENPGQRRAWFQYAGAGLLGTASFLFFAAPWLIGSAVLATSRRLVRRVLLAIGAVGSATALLYIDAYGAVSRSAGDFQRHRSLEPTPFNDSVSWVRRWIGVPIAQLTTRADQRFATAITVVIVIPILAVAARHLVRGDHARLLCYLVAPQVFVHLGAAVAQSALHRRYTAALLIPTAALFGIGVGSLAASASTRLTRVGRIAPIAGFVAVLAVTGRFVHQNLDEVRIPLEDFRSPARRLDRFEAAAGPVDQLIVSKRTYGVTYYFDRPVSAIRTSAPYAVSLAELERLACSSLDQLAFVTFGGPLEDEALACVVDRGGERHVYEQRSRGGQITLWLLPANAPSPPG